MKSGMKLGLFAVGLAVAFVIVFLLVPNRSDTLSVSPPALEARAEQLQATRVSAVLDVPIQPGTNLLWCGTFQLAWNEALEFFGEDLNFAEDVPLARILNRKEFDKDDLDGASYVTFGGAFTPDVPDRIRREVRRKFDRSFNPQLIPQADANLATIFYACLSKNLAFGEEFQRIERPLVFCTNEVAAFGIEGYAKWEVREQVRVLDYRNTNDFVIELKTKSVSDKLILAKVAPKETLAETVNGVCRRIESKGQEPAEFNRLVIPKTDFALTRTYEEFLGKTLILKRSAEWNLPVVIAEQLVRFRLDERGAMLQSEAAVAVNSAMSAEPIDLVFDKPFLILLQRVDAGAPYFALWIDNAELLAPWHSERNTIVSSR